MNVLPPQAPSTPITWRYKLPILVALTILLATLVVTHYHRINGPWYWKWPWRYLNAGESPRWYAFMLLASLPVIAATFVRQRAIAMLLLILGVFALKLMVLGVLTKPPNFDVLGAIVRDPDATSYYTDAAALTTQPGWLAQYHDILPHTSLHTQSKPPGAVAFFALFIRAFGYGERSAVASGIVMAALATLSVPAAYSLVRTLTGDAAVAIVAATMLSLCPGFTIICPTFDAIWVSLACAMLITWHYAVVRDDWRWAIAFGAALSVACFATYNLLVLGAFLAAWTIKLRPKTRAAARLVAVAASAFVSVYLVMWIFTGFDPVATFVSAWTNQHALLAQHREDRPYPWTILFDLTDFALGAGWLVVALAGMYLARRPRALLPWLCVAQPSLVAVLGLLQSETARAWNFMLPLILVPAASELSTWPTRARLITYGCMLVILLVVARHMRFMGP